MVWTKNICFKVGYVKNKSHVVQSQQAPLYINSSSNRYFTFSLIYLTPAENHLPFTSKNIIKTLQMFGCVMNVSPHGNACDSVTSVHLDIQIMRDNC